MTDPTTSLISLLREARQFVNDAGDEEDTEVNEHRWDLLARIDSALAGSAISLIEAAAQAAEWQPIESAPRTGNPVLLWKEATKEHYVAAWIYGDHPGWCTPDGFEIYRATHWMPLPPPPEQALHEANMYAGLPKISPPPSAL